MLRIRLSRVGKKKQPAYRIVVADSRSPRDGAFLKIIGHYNPLTDPVTLVVKEEEAVHWLEKGARPSETAAKLLTRIGVMERAGRPPVRYVGKEMPATEKKEAKVPAAATAEPKAKAQAKAPAEAKAEAPKEPAETEAPEAKVEATEAELPKPLAETPESEETAPTPEEAREEAAEPETEEALTETEPEATSEEQSQEQAENQE